MEVVAGTFPGQHPPGDSMEIRHRETGEIIFDSPGSSLAGGRFRGARLHHAELRGADLSGADLQGADLCIADLSGAALNGANLTGVDLSGATLSGAGLDGALLADANLPRRYQYAFDLAGNRTQQVVTVAGTPAEATQTTVIVGNSKVSGEIIRNYSDISKARRVLGYSPQTDLKTGLRKTWDWFQNNKEKVLSLVEH